MNNSIKLSPSVLTIIDFISSSILSSKIWGKIIPIMENEKNNTKENIK